MKISEIIGGFSFGLITNVLLDESIRSVLNWGQSLILESFIMLASLFTLKILLESEGFLELFDKIEEGYDELLDKFKSL